MWVAMWGLEGDWGAEAERALMTKILGGGFGVERGFAVVQQPNVVTRVSVSFKM